MVAADYCTCTTLPLATAMRGYRKPVFVLPNGIRAASEAAVVIPLYRLREFLVEALESVKAQTIAQREFDRCGLAVASGWLRINAAEFTHVALLKHRKNSGLVSSRNTGFLFSDARFIMRLDADNTIEPRCLERCLAVIHATGAAASYPTIRKLGESHDVLNRGYWMPTHFSRGNHRSGTLQNSSRIATEDFSSSAVGNITRGHFR